MDKRKIEHMVVNHLITMGAPEHLLGFNQAITAITACVENPDLIHKMTKDLYPLVARAHGTTPSRVERAIRHMVEICFDRCDTDVINQYFGGSISLSKGKATNSEFIAKIAGIVQREIEDEGDDY